MKQIKQAITPDHLSKSLTYEQYRNLIDELLEKNKATGENQSESLLAYSKLNVQRMNKWDKISKISDELQSTIDKINEQVHWVILTEGWCGDAAQNLPFIAKLAAQNDHISFHIFLRDDHLDLMDSYLTNGGRSIPKLILLDKELNETGEWGPRPVPVQEKLMEMKSSSEFSYDEFGIFAHTWYAKDKTKTLQRELLKILS